VPDAAATDGLLTEYRRILLLMHDARVESGGTPRRWNELVNRMQGVHLLLRETDAGRAGITDLIDDDCVTVRAWSATHALAWPVRARAELERLVREEQGLTGFNAQVTLREFHAGRLKTDWVP
jgi:hypothetical protein